MKSKARDKTKVLKRERLHLQSGVFARAHDVAEIPGWEKPGRPKSRDCECVRCKYVGTLPKELPDDTDHDERMSLLAVSINRLEAETGQRLWPAVAKALWRQLVDLAERFPKARPRVRATRKALNDAARSSRDGSPADLADALARAEPETRPGRKKSTMRPAWKWSYVGGIPPMELRDDTRHDERMSLLFGFLHQREAETNQRFFPAVTEALWRQLVVVHARFPKARPGGRGLRAALSGAVRPTAVGGAPDLAEALARVMPETRAGRKPSAKRPAWEWTEMVCRWFESTLTRHWNGHGYAAATEKDLIARWTKLKQDHPLVTARSNPRRGFSDLTEDLREDLRLQLKTAVPPATLALHLAHLALGISENLVEKRRRQHRRHHPPVDFILPDNRRDPVDPAEAEAPDTKRGSRKRWSRILIERPEPPPFSEK